MGKIGNTVQMSTLLEVVRVKMEKPMDSKYKLLTNINHLRDWRVTSSMKLKGT